MDFELSDEQKLLAETVDRFAERSYGFDARRAILESEEGWSRDIWGEVASMGLTAIAVPAEHGGLGAGPVEMMLVMKAIGHCLLLEPFAVSAVTAATLIDRLGSEEQKAALLPGVADGSSILAFAHEERGMRGDFSRVTTKARGEGGAFVLDGAKSVVMHAGAADRLLVSARTSGDNAASSGLSVFVVDPRTAGVSLRAYRTLDGLSAADIALKGAKVGADALLGAKDAAWPAISAAIDATLAALAAEAVGAMQELNRLTAEYLKTRKQFGQPLAVFQALRHRYAEMLTQAEQANSMAIMAALSLGDGEASERNRRVAAAKAFIGKAAKKVSQEAVQMHGGMGVTEEMAASHYFRRLMAIELSWGASDIHRERFIAESASYRA